MKSNKWNVEDCGPSMAISGDELIVTHGSNSKNKIIKIQKGSGINSVRAMPIPVLNLAAKKPFIAFYFEVQILNTRLAFILEF